MPRDTSSTQIERVQDAQPWRARIEAPSAVALRRELSRAMRRGELAAVGPAQRTAAGYAVEVWRLKARRTAPAWRRPVLIAAGVVSTLAAAAAVGWWLAAPVAPAALVAAVVLLFLRLATPRRRGCTTTVTITHRR